MDPEREKRDYCVKNAVCYISANYPLEWDYGKKS